LAGALIKPVSIIIAGTLLGVKIGALVTPMIADASWTKSSLIPKVTTGTLVIEVRAKSEL